jgi:hypothetical protein
MSPFLLQYIAFNVGLHGYTAKIETSESDAVVSEIGMRAVQSDMLLARCVRIPKAGFELSNRIMTLVLQIPLSSRC